MKVQLKRLNEQVLVITGASSGIGLATARMAAERGAKLVLAARSGGDVHQLVEEIERSGGQAIAAAADVASETDMRRIAEDAVRTFGRIDTWINNAGVSVYGLTTQVPLDDMRRVFETNLWGVVIGSRIAVEHLRRHGGALINVGSETSDKAIPLQGIYSASKHAVKGWTDALRIELADEGAPISVTLIKPAAIDTPFTQHAKNYLEDKPTHAPPVYVPEAVAEAILYAATTPVRDVFVGGGAKFISSLEKVSPRVADTVVRKLVIPGTHSGRPPLKTDALHRPGGGLHERGDYEGHVRRSLYTRATTHPTISRALGLAAGFLMVALWRRAGAPSSTARGSRRDQTDAAPGLT